MSDTTPWQERLLVVLMLVSGVGWLVLAGLDLLTDWTGRWLPDWPFGVVAAVGVLELAGAWGLDRRRWWGWTLALLFVGVGAAGLLSQLATLFTNGDALLFLLNSVGLLSLSWMVRNREEFGR